MSADMLLLLAIIVAAAIALVLFSRLVRRRISPRQAQILVAAWKRIESQKNPRQGVIAADSLLEHALKLKGFSGSVKERLKQAQPLLPNINALWSAHRLRNVLIHEVDRSVSDHECQRALKDFKKALCDLGVPL